MPLEGRHKRGPKRRIEGVTPDHYPSPHLQVALQKEDGVTHPLMFGFPPLRPITSPYRKLPGPNCSILDLNIVYHSILYAHFLLFWTSLESENSKMHCFLCFSKIIRLKLAVVKCLSDPTQKRIPIQIHHQREDFKVVGPLEHDDKALMIRNSSLIKARGFHHFLLCVDTSRRLIFEEGALTMTLDFAAPRNMRNKCLLFIS